MHHHARLIFIFYFLVETGFHHVGQAGLELLTSRDPTAWASHSAGITGMSHCAQLAASYRERFTQGHPPHQLPPLLSYLEAGASWAHRALAGPPGRAEGRAHRHVHQEDTLPASSGHSPGSRDRQLHLGRKQKAGPAHGPAGLGPCTRQRCPSHPPLSPPELAGPGSGHCSGQALPP